MPRVTYTNDENTAFLISCVEHASQGKPNFARVADEMRMRDKTAASSRYKNLKKKVSNMPLNLSSDPISPEHTQAKIAKIAEEKRRQIEGNGDPTVDDEEIKPKLDSFGRVGGDSRHLPDGFSFSSGERRYHVDLTSHDWEDDIKPAMPSLPLISTDYSQTSSGQGYRPLDTANKQARLGQMNSIVKQEHDNDTAGPNSFRRTNQFGQLGASTAHSQTGHKSRSIKQESKPDPDAHEESCPKRIEMDRLSAVGRPNAQHARPTYINIDD